MDILFFRYFFFLSDLSVMNIVSMGACDVARQVASIVAERRRRYIFLCRPLSFTRVIARYSIRSDRRTSGRVCKSGNRQQNAFFNQFKVDVFLAKTVTWIHTRYYK